MNKIFLKKMKDNSILFILKEDSLYEEGLKEISSEEHSKIINKNGEYRVLKNGMLGHYLKPKNDKFMVNEKFDYEKEIYIEDATQEEFLYAKNDIEQKMTELYRDINARTILNLSIKEHNLKMSELKSRLNYIEENIVIKV